MPTSGLQKSKIVKYIGLASVGIVMIVFPILSGFNVWNGLKDRKHILDLSILGPAPEFAFKDIKGDLVSSETLKGSLVIAGFMQGGYFPPTDTFLHRVDDFSRLFSEDAGILFVNFYEQEPDDTIDKLHTFLSVHTKLADDKKFIFIPVDRSGYNRLKTDFHLSSAQGTIDKPCFLLIDKRWNRRKLYNALEKKSVDSLAVAAIMLPKKKEEPQMKR